MSWRQSIRLSLSVVPREWRLSWIWLTALAFLTSLLEMVAALAVLWLIQMMIAPNAPIGGRRLVMLDQMLRNLGGVDPVLALAIGVAFFYALKSGLSGYVVYRQAHVSMLSGAEFARALFGAYLSAPYAYHLHKNSAEIQRNIGLATDAIFYYILFSLVGLASEGLMVLALLAVTAFVAPLTTALVAAVLGAMTGVVYRVTQGRLYDWGEEMQRLGKGVLATVEESIAGLKEIKILGRESYFVGVYGSRRRGHGSIEARRLAIQVFPRLALETMFVALIALVLVASKFVPEGGGGVLPLLGLYAYTGFRVMPSVARILSYLQNIRYGSGSAQDVWNDLGLLERRAPPEARPAGAAFVESIELKGVTFTYPGAQRPSVRGVELTIRRGQSVGIVGSTGAGKSTLLDLIAGVYEPDVGEILADGTPIKHRLRDWQSHIGYVPQATFLVDDTVRRNIALGLAEDEIDDARIAEAVRIAQLEDFVASLPSGLETVVGQRGVRLSGGQRQRIAIARALAHRPDLLLLDEATAALDTRTEHYLSEAVQRLSGTMTLLIVAHRLETVRSCDRLLVMQDGVIVDSGTYDDLLARSAAFRTLALSDAKVGA